MEMRHYHKEIKWLSNGGKDANQATTSNGNNTNSCSLLPVSVQQRCALLKASGVNIDYKEIKDCNRLRSSRADCGCKCIHSCNPDTCTCSIENIKCHLERTSFPCSCTSDSCRNPNGRIEYNKKSMHTKIQNILNNIK